MTKETSKKCLSLDVVLGLISRIGRYGSFTAFSLSKATVLEYVVEHWQFLFALEFVIILVFIAPPKVMGAFGLGDYFHASI